MIHITKMTGKLEGFQSISTNKKNGGVKTPSTKGII